jgi:hypothetical protein
MRTISIKSGVIAAILMAGAFTATSASAFGFHGGFGQHFGGGHHFGRGYVASHFRTVGPRCHWIGRVDDDGNPVMTKVCFPR